MPKELQPHTAIPAWDSMSPGEKQAWLLDMALDVKKNILSAPLPDPNDDSAEAHRMRSLILAAADSTIEQTIRLQTNQLKPAAAYDDKSIPFEFLDIRLNFFNLPTLRKLFLHHDAAVRCLTQNPVIGTCHSGLCQDHAT